MESVVTNLNVSAIYTASHAVTKEQHSDIPWEYLSQLLSAKLLLMEMRSTGAPQLLGSISTCLRQWPEGLLIFEKRQSC